MATIYIETVGTDEAKPDLVMLHGWAMHGGLMRGLADKLSTRFRVHLVDLPGHGASTLNGSSFDIYNLAESVFTAVSGKLNGDATWLGWSMGGLVAIKIAELHPQSVSSMVLLASSPAFVKKDGWPHAVDKEVLESFAGDLQNDLASTITRFLTLQVRGATDSRQTLKQLREILFTRELASEDALREGLRVLEQTDLRYLFNEINFPVLIIGGERDTLVPSTALIELAKKYNIKTSIIEKAGHAPFLSHPDQCAEVITGFLS